MTGERITTPFGAQSTAMEVVEGVEIDGARAIVTGGSSGIGLETARALVSAGAEVTLAVRGVDAGDHAAQDIKQSTGRSEVLVAPLDLADQASVAAFVASWDGPLHILVNNAGGWPPQSFALLRGGSCSLPPTISVTSTSPPVYTARLRRPAVRGSWSSAQSATSTARSSSTT
jgi:NAD(P)-dependent dehydrogenase (short-subunit alcohol dehydrogenase family)